MYRRQAYQSWSCSGTRNMFLSLLTTPSHPYSVKVSFCWLINPVKKNLHISTPKFSGLCRGAIEGTKSNYCGVLGLKTILWYKERKISTTLFSSRRIISGKLRRPNLALWFANSKYLSETQRITCLHCYVDSCATLQSATGLFIALSNAWVLFSDPDL